MARVKRSVNAQKKRRTLLETASGYRGQRSRLYRKAKEQVLHSMQYAYRDRRDRKGDFRQLWITRINAAARENNITYNRNIFSKVGVKPPTNLDEMLDVMKHCLSPAGINPRRRTAELTVAILQLVASGRGIAALPSWTVGNYIERGYVVSRPIGESGLRCELYAATSQAGAQAAYIREFIALTRAQSLTTLAGVSAL